MKALARLSLRGRRGQVAALGATLLFSAIVLGALGLLFETGARGRVETGEYAAAPLLVAAGQSLAVDSDVDVAVPGRALLRTAVVDDLREAVPDGEVVVDRIVPAVVATGTGADATVAAHPWSAWALGDRTLVEGRGPEAANEVVIPRSLGRDLGIEVGDRLELLVGGDGDTHVVVGLTSADDTGVDDADVHVADDELPERVDGGRTVAAVGVWPADADETAAVEAVAERHDVRVWGRGDRGPVEVVAQGQARGTLTSAAGAFGALAVIVTIFATAALVSVQVRERTRELAILRVAGATPRQVRDLLRLEARRVAVVAGAVGAVAGPLLGAVVVAVIRSRGAVPRTLDPVVGPLPLVLPLAVVVLATEVSVRISLRRVVRGSPLAGLDGADERAARGSLRLVLGLLLLVGGLVLAAAPWYLSGEAATGLPAVSGLVVALAVGALAPGVVRLAERVVRRRVGRTAEGHLALASIRLRAGRLGGVLAPIVLGVTLSGTQILTGTTYGAVAADQASSGVRADLVVASSGPGVGEDLITLVEATDGVASTVPLAAGSVAVRGPATDSSWQVLPSLGAPGDGVGRYADLGLVPGGRLPLRPGEVALGVQGAALLGAGRGDVVRLVLPDGQGSERRVAAIYERGLGLGEVLLPLDEVLLAEPTGRPTALAVTIADEADHDEVAAAVEEAVGHRPDVDVTGGRAVTGPGPGAGEATFQVILLLVIWGYIALAVVSSLVTATLARRRELALLRSIGATPAQRRGILRVEALFLGTTACVVGALVSVPGLVGLTYALSNGDRRLPAPAPVAMVLVVAAVLALTVAATAGAGRRADRDGSGSTLVV